MLVRKRLEFEAVGHIIGASKAIGCDYAGLESMFAGQAVARSALRWQVLHRGARKPRVLPPDLSCAYGEGEELPLLSDGSCGGRSWISAVLEMPTGELSGNTGVAGNFDDGLACTETDRRKRA